MQLQTVPTAHQGNPPAAMPQDKLARYERALATFDFYFEHADDGAAYRKGKAALAELHAMQQEVDPNGAAWLRYVDSHGMSRVPLPRVGVFS